MQQVIPPHLLEKLNEFGKLALRAEEIKTTAKALAGEIVVLGRELGFSDFQIKDMLKQAIHNVGLSDRSYQYALPEELKDKTKQAAGFQGARVRNNKNESEPVAQTQEVEVEQVNVVEAAEAPAVLIEEKPQTQTAQAADKDWERELTDENFALQAKVKELEEALARASVPKNVKTENLKVKIPLRMFGKVFASLKSNCKHVVLSIDPKTLEVFEAESVRA